MLSAADQIPAVPGKPVAAAAAAARHNNNNANNGQAGGSSSRSSELSRVAAKRGVFYRAFRKDFVGVVGSESTWFKKHTAATGNDCERIM